jgi:hypothetical protein
MKRIVALLAGIALLAGCGTYRITYRMPSKEAQAESGTIEKGHSHGFGLIGGGGYFFAIHQMFPALIDYTGERQIAEVCPNGAYEIEHHTEFWHNAGAALISWLVIVNVYHPSEVHFRCLRAPEPALALPASQVSPATETAPATEVPLGEEPRPAP